MRCGGQQDELLVRLAGDAANEVVALLLAGRGAGWAGTGVRLIDDDKLRTLLDEDIAPNVRLDEVDADDLVRVVVVDAGVTMNLAIESGLGVGPDDHGLDIKLGADFGLPLLAQVRQANDREALDLAALYQLTHDQQRFDRLTNAHVVGDQQPGRLLTQGHDQWNHLVRTRPKRQLGQTPKRTSAVAEREACRVVNDTGGRKVSKVFGGGRREVCVGRLVTTERQVEPGDFVVRSTERPKHQQLVVVGWQNYPVAPTQRHQFSGLE